MSLTKNLQKNEIPMENSDLANWKRDFFNAVKTTSGINTIYLRLETYSAQKRQMQHRIIATLGWKRELPAFVSDSSLELAVLRKELSATLRVNGIQVLHKKDEWMRHLKNHHEVGSSYAKLCGAC